MRTLFLIAGILLAASGVFAQALNDPPNLVDIEVGDNYYGQSLALAYSTRLIDHLWAHFSVESGNFSAEAKADSSFLIFFNSSDNTYNVGLNLQDVETVSLFYVRAEKGEFRFLNSLGLGLTYFDTVVSVSDLIGDNPNAFQGQKSISAFALYTDLHLVDFHPTNDQLVFSLGIKGSTAFLPSPQTVTTRNSVNQTTVVGYKSADGGPLAIPYLELFFNVGRYFD